MFCGDRIYPLIIYYYWIYDQFVGARLHNTNRHFRTFINMCNKCEFEFELNSQKLFTKMGFYSGAFNCFFRLSCVISAFWVTITKNQNTAKTCFFRQNLNILKETNWFNGTAIYFFCASLGFWNITLIANRLVNQEIFRLLVYVNYENT